MNSPWLLLFDIDGTLLDTGGAGLGALKEGFLEAFPHLDGAEGAFPQLELAGATDGGIARSLFTQFEIELHEENLESFYQAYLRHLEARLERHREQGRLLPGVRDLLHHLRDETDHVLGLLTGNIARGAWTKIRHFELEGIFVFGAFGDDHHDRNLLGPIAMERAKDHVQASFEPERTCIIGDTPKDIACARACGALAVAVATGSYSADQLEQHRPDHLFTDLCDLESFLDALRPVG